MAGEPNKVKSLAYDHEAQDILKLCHLSLGLRPNPLSLYPSIISLDLVTTQPPPPWASVYPLVR